MVETKEPHTDPEDAVIYNEEFTTYCRKVLTDTLQKRFPNQIHETSTNVYFIN